LNLRHLAYLVALDREGHFGRAAVASNVTQPSLSSAIRQLEDELGAPLVRRTQQRFDGLTPEGRRVVAWARQILADCDALKQSLAEARTALRGELRIGVIPTAEPIVATLTAAFHARFPGVTVSTLSRTADNIARAISEHAIEAGISYMETTANAGLQAVPLYVERYALVGAPELLPRRRGTATWREAAQCPLVLLTRNMHNRVLIDRVFNAAHTAPSILVETDTLIGVLSHVRSGQWASVVPLSLGRLVPGLIALPLTEPAAGNPVGLFYLPRDPLAPIVAALLAIIETTSFDAAVP
jgi:DNA-binding transcriptional LysR family regulator